LQVTSGTGEQGGEFGSPRAPSALESTSLRPCQSGQGIHQQNGQAALMQALAVEPVELVQSKRAPPVDPAQNPKAAAPPPGPKTFSQLPSGGDNAQGRVM